MKEIREKFRNISNYIVYYGHGMEQELSKYHMAVIEPMGHTDDDIIQLKAAGTIAIAYLSAMEIHPSHSDFKLVMDERLKYNCSFVMNNNYGTYIMDMGSEIWNRLLAYNALKLCHKHHYDGIFLDTLGDVDTFLIPGSLRQMQTIHAISFAKTLRKALPDSVIIQNNGIENLSMHTSNYIDGICWEGPDLIDKGRAQYNEGILERLKYLMEEKHIRIMMLCDNSAQGIGLEIAKEFAYKNNFIFYNAPFGYTCI